jgi:hypothetical protein
MKPGFTRLALAAALALGAVPLRAESPLEPPDLARYLRWGPVRARPGFLLSNIGYDNNIFYRTDVPPVGDYVATLSPKVEGVVLFGHRGFLTFKEQLDWTAYMTHRDQSYLNQRGSGRLTVPFKALGVYVDGVLNDTKERPADALAIRTDVRELGSGTGILITPGWRTDGEFGIFRSSHGYTNANYYNSYDPACPTIGCTLDRTERGMRARGRYLLAGRARLTLEWSNRDITFSNTGVGRDATQKRLVPGLDFGLGGRLTGTVRYGWAHLDSKNPGYPDYDGPVGEARLSYRFGAGTTVQAGGLRDIGFSTYVQTGYYEDVRYDARVIQYFNRILGAEAGAGRGRLLFPASASPLLPEDRMDRLVEFDGGLRVRVSETTLGRRVEYSLKVTRWTLVSNYPGIDQTRTTLGFNAVIGY